MLRQLFSLFICLPLFVLAQEDLPFQVLVAEGATIYDEPVKAMQFVNDVTSIEIKDNGFLSLVHIEGTTFELSEKIFTFYLKPEELKNRGQRPNLNVLYSDSTILDQSKLITILHPQFDRSGFLEWNQNEPFEFSWHLHDEPVVVYVISLMDGNGNKIQDFRTKYHKYILKPTTFGLKEPTFMVQLSSTFAGETVTSKRYQIKLVDAPVYQKKATDLVLKALDLELSPVLALEVWKETLAMPNGENYSELFKLFLKRNSEILIAAGEDIELLLSQSK